MTPTSDHRYIARLAVGGDRANHPVQYINGTVEPHWLGESYYWTTLSGRTIVHHPSAYKWPTLYHPSTLRIVVGREWAGLRLSREAANALSSERLPALAMRLAASEPISVAEIDTADNEEYRRGLMEIYGGVEPYMRDAGAEAVHSDDTGTLWRRSTAGQSVVAVEVQCPTTGRVYMLRVDPACTTARQAVAWTFGLSESDYRPTMES